MDKRKGYWSWLFGGCTDAISWLCKFKYLTISLIIGDAFMVYIWWFTELVYFPLFIFGVFIILFGLSYQIYKDNIVV